MYPQALAYIGIGSSDLTDWSTYGTSMVGMQLVDHARSALSFRMDDRKQRILVDHEASNGIKFFGWEVASKDDLDALGAHLERRQVRFRVGSRSEADKRFVEGFIYLNDPLGNQVEFCWGAMTTTDPFVPGRSISGFRTGALGLGHVVMSVERIDGLADFYRNTLGFRVSDYYDHPFPAMFFHVNPRHHSLAFVQSGKTAVHHLMLEHFHLDDVGQGYDLAQLEEGRLAVSLGRHAGDYMTSFYTRTPSEFMVEHGWGGRLIDPETWQPAERKEGPSLWGHERSWATPDVREKALRQRLKNAADGLRRPVQVIEGNYNLMPGVCSWWDGIHSEATDASAFRDERRLKELIDVIDIE